MGTQEFSDRFDVLYNNITSNQAPGLNEYEKSIFLTKAQDETIKNYFLPQSNSKQAGFDGNQKRQADFSMLMGHAELTPDQTLSSADKFDPRSSVYKMPTDLFLIINEQINIEAQGSNTLIGIRQVTPISYDEYSRLMRKPYKEPLKYEAWRLLTTTSTTTVNSTTVDVSAAEIICTSSDRNLANSRRVYHLRYVKRPSPIILTNLSGTLGEGLTINGENTAMTCKLDPILHEEILQRAVELAKIAWQGDVSTSVQTGQRSE